MRVAEPITFVVAMNKREVLENNFLASPCVQGSHAHQILLQENFASAGAAYNDAIDRSANDLLVFCHQDMYFPESWQPQLEVALEHLGGLDPEWGVLGCSGITRDGALHGVVYSSGVGIIGQPSEPEPVQTLDEIVLILRKSSGLRFDETLPHFHLYGADICLRARERGRKSYAISAFCVHNTHQSLILPPEFYEGCEWMRRKWKGELPIQTTCIRITRWNLPIYRRRMNEWYLRYIRHKEVGGRRSVHVGQILDEVRTQAKAHGAA